jgi:hypothetical protein
MFLWQTTVSTAEPILIGGAVVVTGSVFTWAARTLFLVDRRVREMHQSLFGHPDSKESSGLIAEQAETKRKMENVTGRVETLEWHISNTFGLDVRHPPRDPQ